VNRPSAKALAEDQQRHAREALSALGQWIYPTVGQQRLSTEVYWEAAFRAPVKICGRRGDWTLHGTWRYWDDPLNGEGCLRESSIGVTVSNTAIEGLPDGVCVARYDVECHGARRGRHLNVFQPVVGDSVHWVIPTEPRYDDWPLEETLRFLIEDLCPELTAAGWPA